MWCKMGIRLTISQAGEVQRPDTPKIVVRDLLLALCLGRMRRAKDLGILQSQETVKIRLRWSAMPYAQ